MKTLIALAAWFIGKVKTHKKEMRYINSILLVFLLLGCNSKIPHKNSKSINEIILDEKDLVPEGIAYSENEDAFYLTSVGLSKIIKVDRKTGKQDDFIKKHEFKYSPGAGIWIDDEHHLLHAIGGYYALKDSLSSLYTFDLDTNELLKRYDVATEGQHFLNDLVKDNKGNIYLTDTKDSSVYMLRKGNDILELFYKSEEIKYPNGIAISDDNTKLYVASATHGVRVIDISTKEILNKKDTLGLTQGIDGLEFYHNHLFAVQNGVKANLYNFRKLILNQNQDEITGVEVLDSNTEKLDVPLTFCIVDGKAVVIGNSNLQYLNQENYIFAEADSIKKTRLIVYQIN